MQNFLACRGSVAQTLVGGLWLRQAPQERCICPLYPALVLTCMYNTPPAKAGLAPGAHCRTSSTSPPAASGSQKGMGGEAPSAAE